MKRTLPLLTLSLSLFWGCGKDKPTEVSNNQTPPEESGDNGTSPPEATPEKGSAKSGKNAESGQRPGGRLGRGGSSNPFAELGVNASQQEELDAAREEMRAQMTPLFTNREISREDREAKMTEIREAFMAKVKSILTEEQFAKYEESRNNRAQGQGSGRRPGQGGFGGRGDSLASLNLNEDQQAKVTAIQAEQRDEQTKLFQELRSSGGGFEGVREKMTALRTKYDSQIEALLTEDQKEKYKEIQAQRGQRGSRRPGGESSGGRRPGSGPGSGGGRRPGSGNGSGSGFNRGKSKAPRDN